MPTHFPIHRGLPRATRGFSLVEILVATVIGLIGIVVISQVYTVSEGLKRTTTGGADAVVNGNIALYSLDRDLRYAGYGMVTNNSNMLGCTTLAYDNTRLGSTTFSFTMAPASILVGSAGAPDEITVVYGSGSNIIEGSAFSGTAAAGADFPLKNAAGLNVGNLVVAYEAGKSCTVAEVLGFQPAAVNTVIHGPSSRYNQAGGLGVAYTASALLFDMGPSPVVRTYKIVNGKLHSESMMPYAAALDTGSDGDSDADIADGIVHMKAQYGKDTDGDHVIDAWNTTAPVTSADWLQVRAIRVALLARSGQWEKAAIYTPAGCLGAACSPAAPSWRQDNGTVVYYSMSNPADGTDWRNYRYTTYQTTIPLRNMIWSTD